MLDVDLRDDLDLHDFLRREGVPELVHVFARAGEDHWFTQHFAPRPVFVAERGGPFAEQQCRAGQRGKHRHDGAARHFQPQKVGAPGDQQPQPHGRACELLERLAHRLLQRVRVKSLQLEQQRARRQDHEKQPLEIAKRTDRLVEKEPFAAEKAQRVRGPKGDDDQESIDDLEELEIEFLSSAEHARRAKNEGGS